LDKYFLLYSHYIFWNVMVLLLEYVFSVLFPPLLTAHFCLHFSLSLFLSVWSAELVTLSLEENSLAAYAHGVSQRTPTSAPWWPGIAEIRRKRSQGWCKRWLVMMCHTVSNVNYLSQESYI